MPCNGGYLDPTKRQAELQRTARLLVYVRQRLGRPIPGRLLDESRNVYCEADFVPDLCADLLSISPAARDDLIYRVHDRQARDLANWWEDHLEADQKRLARERADAAAAAARASALAKLTPEERRALGF